MAVAAKKRVERLCQTQDYAAVRFTVWLFSLGFICLDKYMLYGVY